MYLILLLVTVNFKCYKKVYATVLETKTKDTCTINYFIWHLLFHIKNLAIICWLSMAKLHRYGCCRDHYQIYVQCKPDNESFVLCKNEFKFRVATLNYFRFI